MDNFFNDSISIEKFAAYLDGNLSKAEMSKVYNIVMQDPELSELVDLSDSIDQEIQDYVNDEFLFDADMSMLDECDLEIPSLDCVITQNTDLTDYPYQEVACASSDVNDEIKPYDDAYNGEDIDSTIADNGIGTTETHVVEVGNNLEQEIIDPSNINIESVQGSTFDPSSLEQEIFSPGE